MGSAVAQVVAFRHFVEGFTSCLAVEPLMASSFQMVASLAFLGLNLGFIKEAASRSNQVKAALTSQDYRAEDHSAQKFNLASHTAVIEAFADYTGVDAKLVLAVPFIP